MLGELIFILNVLFCAICVVLLNVASSNPARFVKKLLRDYTVLKPAITHPAEIDDVILRDMLIRSGRMRPNESVQIIARNPLGDGRMSCIEKLTYECKTPSTSRQANLVLKSMPNAFTEQIFTLLFNLHVLELEAYNRDLDHHSELQMPELVYSNIGLFGQYLLIIEFIERGVTLPFSQGISSRPLIESIVRRTAQYHAASWHHPHEAVTNPEWSRICSDGPFGHVNSLGIQLMFKGIWSTTKHLQPEEFQDNDIVELIELYLDNLPLIHHNALIESSTALTHGDLHTGNILVIPEEPGFILIDWQATGPRPALMDLGIFIGLAIPTQTRRELGDELLQLYAREVSDRTGQIYTFEECKYEFTIGLMSILVPLMFMGYLVQSDAKKAIVHVESTGRRAKACIRDYDLHGALERLARY